MENEEVKHKRRVRYSGTHPRRFEEKYKELNPEKYSRDIEHIISRGSYSGGNAHFNNGQRDTGISRHKTGTDRS